jgi:hypothetical protein
VGTYHHAAPGRPYDAYAAPAPVQGIPALRLVEVAHQDHRGPGPLRHPLQGRQRAPHVLVAVGVHVPGEGSHYGVYNDQDGPHLFDRAL